MHTNRYLCRAHSGPLSRTVLSVLAIVIATGSTGLAAGASLPPSLTHGKQLAPAAVVVADGSVNVAQLLQEDAAAAESPRRAGPFRFAATVDVAIATRSHGRWERLESGWQLWRVEIAAPGALSLSARIESFDLPSGGRMWLYDANGAQVRGPYTAADRDRKGGLSTPIILGDRMRVEVLTPPGFAARSEILFSEIYHGYRYFGESRAAHDKRGSCNVNVVCPDGDPWRDQIRSIARYTIGPYLCTGNLLNNTAEDQRPLFLTAGHCEVTEINDNTIVVYWNFESPTCDDLFGGSLSDTQIGASHLATWGSVTTNDEGGDMTLIELDDQPDPDYNVYFAGWDATDTVPQSVVAIHHPSGDEKSISYDNDPLTVARYIDRYGDDNWLRVDDWDTGTTEGGSSGSCIFSQANGRCVGILSGGYAACGNDDPDWYAWVHRQWEGGGTPETRLRDWLDPISSGATTIAGLDSGDPPQPTETAWLIPAAASTPGFGTSNWKTQIEIVNHTAATRTATVYWVEQGDAWPGELLDGPYTLGAKEAKLLDDPLLPSNPTSGLVYVALDESGPIVTSRTFNLEASGSTFGQGIPGILLDTAESPSELILPLAHSSPGRFHSNLGLVQTSSGSFSVFVTVFSANGTELAHKTYIQSGAFQQVNDLFSNMGIGNQTASGAWVRVRLVAGSPAYWTAYLSVVDDLSNDPTYIAGVAP